MKRDVIFMKDDDEMKEIKNQRHSCISHQMKDGSGDLIVNRLKQAE